MKIKFSILLLLLFQLWAFGQEQGAPTQYPLTFECVDCNIGVKILLDENTACGAENINLRLEIEGNPTQYHWENSNGTTHTGETWEDAPNTGTYIVTVSDENSCTATATFNADQSDEEGMKAFFEANCFMSIPVGYTPPGGGLQPSGQARLADFEVEITGLRTPNIFISELFNVDALSGLTPKYSETCEEFDIHKANYLEGTAWAHIIPNEDRTTGTLYIGAKGFENTNDGVLIIDAFRDFWNLNSDDHVLSAPINYTCGADQFLDSNIGDDWLMYLKLLLDCEDLMAKNGKGIVPHCFWKEAPISLSAYYSEFDIPYTAGIVDGAYLMLKDAAQLIELVGKLQSFHNALMMYPICRGIGIEEPFFEKLEEKTQDLSLFERIKTKILRSIQQGLSAQCEETLKTIASVSETYEKIKTFLSDWEKVQEAFTTIQTKFNEYLAEIATCNDRVTCNNARYEHGKLMLNLASIVLGVGVEDALFKSFSYLSKVLNNIPLNKVDDFLDFMRLKSGSLKNLTPTQRAAFKDASQVLEPKLWDKIVDDPELLDAWSRFRRIGVCGRSATCKYTELLKEVFGEFDPALIKKLEADATANPGFYDKLADDRRLVEVWKVLSELGESFPDILRRNTNFLKDFDELLKNPYYKRVFDPLADGSHVSLLKNNVSAAEEASMKLFVEDNYYRDYNNALAGETSMTPEYRAMKELMESTHSKLPKESEVIVFRGAGERESTFARGLEKGEEFDFKGRFTSSSDQIAEADLFRRGGKGDVIWQIKSKTGIDITKINSNEVEFLFKPFTKFKLDDIVISNTDPNVLIYIITEL